MIGNRDGEHRPARQIGRPGIGRQTPVGRQACGCDLGQARNRRLRQLPLSEVAGLLLVHQAGLPSPLLAHADRLLRGLGLDRARPVRSGWQPLMWMWRR